MENKNIEQKFDEEFSLIQTDDSFARYLFANEGNEDILLHFINATRQNANQPLFESIELSDTFNLKENIHERETIVDVKARTSSGQLVMVEIQNVGNITHLRRILAYIAINYLKPLNIDKDKILKKKKDKINYNLLTPIISINILNFNIKPNNPKMHSVYRMCDIATGEELTRDWEVHLVELKKLLNIDSKDLMLWVMFFTSKNLEKDRKMITKEAPIFKKVFDCYDRFKGNEKLMEAYREGQAYMVSQVDMLIQERLEGEFSKSIEIAKKMLSKNMLLEDISEMTGLSVDEIEKL